MIENLTGKVERYEENVSTLSEKLMQSESKLKAETEKLEMTSEQMKFMQENFAAMEGQWKQEKSQLQVFYLFINTDVNDLNTSQDLPMNRVLKVTR